MIEARHEPPDGPAARGAVGRVHGARARARRARTSRRPSTSSPPSTSSAARTRPGSCSTTTTRRWPAPGCASSSPGVARDQAHVRDALARAGAASRGGCWPSSRGSRATPASAGCGSSPPTCCPRRWRSTPARATRSRSSHPVERAEPSSGSKSPCNVCRSMPEQLCTVNGDVELCYETFGDPEAPAMLLTMGLATQMLGWHEDFCAALADRGFHVIRFDNRDVGRSQRMDGAVPSLVPAAAARQARRQLHARGHGGRRRRPARPPGHRAPRTWSAPRWAA